MKRLALFLVCVSAGFANYSDGFITPEDGYLFGVTWQYYQTPLVVDGGGAYDISVIDNGRLIVKSTSTPLVMGKTGVYDILLGNNAYLLYLDGVTEFIGTGQNTTAILMGGSINCIGTYRYAAPGNENIFIYARNGWSWIDEDPEKGIEGNWLTSGLPFSIEFSNDNTWNFDPVWMSIKVIEIPEPATLLLLGTAALLFRRKCYAAKCQDRQNKIYGIFKSHNKKHL